MSSLKINQSSGFTLIEIMITIAILGIIAAIAIPNYSGYILKAKRSNAKTALLAIASKQETYKIDNKTYGDLSDLGFGADTIYVDADNNITTSAGNSIYTITVGLNIVDGVSNTYTITATPGGGQVKDSKCKGFSLNHLSVKDVTGTDSASNCW